MISPALNVSLSDICSFCKHCSPEKQDAPPYVFAGGTAVQCWLQGSGQDRSHHDIDIFAFDDMFFQGDFSDTTLVAAFAIRGFEKGYFVPYSRMVTTQIEICRGSYFDSEIAPTLDDVRLLEINGMVLPVLSPEFVAISKLSYPNIHRPIDCQDILTLNIAGRIQDFTYLSELLSQTSLHRLVTAYDILNLKTEAHIQEFIASIQRQLIRRFLYWDDVPVEVLSANQIFLLLDMVPDTLTPSDKMAQFIQKILVDTALEGRNRHIAKLGLLFLLMGIPAQYEEALCQQEFLALLYKGLNKLPEQSSNWLGRCKGVYRTLEQIIALAEHLKQPTDEVLPPTLLIRVVQRILFDDFSRFALPLPIKALRNAVETKFVPTTEAVSILHSLIADKKAVETPT